LRTRKGEDSQIKDPDVPLEKRRKLLYQLGMKSDELPRRIKGATIGCAQPILLLRDPGVVGGFAIPLEYDFAGVLAAVQQPGEGGHDLVSDLGVL
jgi:hypothetical protein